MLNIRSAYTYGKTKIFYEENNKDSEVVANLIGSTVYMWLEEDYIELWEMEIKFDNTDQALDFLKNLHDAKPNDCIKWANNYSN